MGKATQDLKKEHETILFVLKILDKMILETHIDGSEKRRYRHELVEFLKTFADKCHHGKEETHLFKALEEKGVRKEGGPIGVMLGEHDRGRRDVLQMTFALIAADVASFNEAAARYRDLLTAHIDKENNVLFAIADQVLDDGEQAALFDKFQEHEETVIGHGVHEKLHEQVKTWAQAYGVTDEHAPAE
jgi:hemerythrin-like domain-containing protein